MCGDGGAEPDTANEGKEEIGEEEDEPVNLDEGLFQEPIVGTEEILHDENGPGARTPASLPSPPSFTPAQWARHCLTHLPYHSGCPICVACRRPNIAQRGPYLY